ncbi:CGNR zinc finger domain-containing protein [Nocardiopsis rhodophaea]|uniref:CGNR zinc finger domain-containing protein n=1 Tax=Nocardiopsis rhodophaea TaxID=280238 RepID=A0ABN2T111_9ACTN
MPYTRPSAPGALERIETFCNSARFLYGEDAFTDQDSARAWLRSHGWAEAGDALDATDLGELVRLREALREHIENGEPAASARAVLNDYARATLLPPQWRGDGETTIPITEGATATTALVGALLATLTTEELAGSRPRLKVCASPECRWVYYDRSPGNNSIWCAMDICGARHKMRAYRSRRPADD